MLPAGGVLAASSSSTSTSVEELAAAMCRAQGPSQALVVAAAGVRERLPSLVYVGLAVMAQDRQSVRYSTLHSSRQGAARLGAVAAASCAAGIAIDTKQVLHVRDLTQGDLGLHDMQYLEQEHYARACYVAPLVVADNSQGALSIAATQPDAFNGQEAWLQVVASLCSPYVLLLRSHEGLLALEGLVSQVLPMHVALQLQDQQRRAALQVLPGAYDQQQLPMPASVGGPQPAAAAPADGPASVGTGHTMATAGAAAGTGAGAVGAAAAGRTGGSTEANRGSSALRQLRAAQRLRQQHPQPPQTQAHQQLQPPQQQVEEGQPQVPSAMQQQQPPQQQQQQQQQPPLRAVQLNWRSGGSLAFWQPRLEQAYQQWPLEQAYQQWALRQWLRLLDGVFLFLVLLSAFGGMLPSRASLWTVLQQQAQQGVMSATSASSSSPLEGLILQVWLLAAVWLLCSLQQQQPTARYLRWRSTVLATLRVLRTLLFCCEAWQLGLSAVGPRVASHHQQQPSGASPLQQGGQLIGQEAAAVGAAATGAAPDGVLSRAGAAACGLLMLLGLLGQLPSPLHAAVQAVCLALITATLVAAQAVGAAGGVSVVWQGLLALTAAQEGGWMPALRAASKALAAANVVEFGLLVLLGWALPVLLVAAVEWSTRAHFLRRIR